MSSAINPINPTIAFDKEGVHHGFLQLPFSHDDSAWGQLMIPISVFKNGEGPTALLTGANHGDEYEGPIALQNLACTLKHDDVIGRIIIVPAFNYPAFQAAKRTSPYDKGNLNRSFPGKPDGTVTEKIADYFQQVLLPMADAVLDFHSGGKTLEFLPFACSHELDDKAQQSNCQAAMEAFNAPYSLVLREIDSQGMYDSAAENLGKVFVSTELGGGGTTTPRTVEIARKGLRNFLIHTGCLKGQLTLDKTTTLTMPEENCFIFSQNHGLVEPLVELGSPVKPEQAIAQIWPLDRTGQAPVIYRSGMSGILTARHFPGLVGTGDCLALITVASDQ